MRIQHRYVPHYGWPALALRRWQTYLEASADMREADVVFHIDCDSRAVSSLLPLLLSSPSFGVLHADNGYYSGSEVHGFEADSWGPLYTRELQGFLGPPRNRPRRYFDQASLPYFESRPPPYEVREGQRCSMAGDDGVHYFYSGFFGGSGAWMQKAVMTLAAWTELDWAKGFEGARVDDESYLNRFFWEQAPATVLTAAFMYPEPPSDVTHPWLWTNFGHLHGRWSERREGVGEGVRDVLGHVQEGVRDVQGHVQGERHLPLQKALSQEASDAREERERSEWEEAFAKRLLRGSDCRQQLESVVGLEEYGRGGVREAGEWEGLRAAGVGEKESAAGILGGICWNVSGARRWFKPVVLNLSKDKRLLFEGSDKSKGLGLHKQNEEL